jgi:2,5-diketo-D-gluconate reductase A
MTAPLSRTTGEEFNAERNGGRAKVDPANLLHTPRWWINSICPFEQHAGSLLNHRNTAAWGIPIAKNILSSSNERAVMTDHIVLNNGVTMPALGLGVFQSSPEDTTTAVQSALTTGYRHIDTAALYNNERQVGEGIHRSGVDRSEVFIETKVWVSDYGYDATLRAFGKAIRKIGVDQLDLLILHQPAPDRFDATIAAYMALEKLLVEGNVRAIGVSNFMRHHLVDLLARTEIVPAVNQIELHPYFTQPDVQSANAEHGIRTQAWSPIGGVTSYAGGSADRKNIMSEPTIGKVAAEHGKTPAQVMLRWHLQRGRSAIPKSTHPERIAENFGVFDFDLAADELLRIDSLDTGRRSGPDPDKPRREDFDRVIPED